MKLTLRAVNIALRNTTRENLRWVVRSLVFLGIGDAHLVPAMPVAVDSVQEEVDEALGSHSAILEHLFRTWERCTKAARLNEEQTLRGRIPLFFALTPVKRTRSCRFESKRKSESLRWSFCLAIGGCNAILEPVSVRVVLSRSILERARSIL